MTKIFNKLKHKWGITSNWSFWMIMLTFSLAGMSIVFLRPVVFQIFGITPDFPLWLKTLLYILLIFPMYQVNLLVFGFLLGQFSFFWEKEKQLGRFLKNRLRDKNHKPRIK